ncbi:unnamed protein product [Adineta ricciae]|uniref:C-type lectin domain-containing protein n=1 Tax=Adineta ricciae TaxID=249248 RepID=A0A813R7L6_ADIRI|nr:unnamed protein product [Adineta ricciae]
MRNLLILLLITVVSATEHWFVFDQYQFQGFLTPLFTLTTKQQEQKYLSFALSTYDRSIAVDIETRHPNGTMKQREQSIKLNIERADLLYNSVNHMIFVAIRDGIKLETYINCKLIDSYFLYSTIVFDDKTPVYKVENISDYVEHHEVETPQDVFDIYSCKPMQTSQVLDNRTTTIITRPLIRKMQHVIEKVQRRKLRSRRHNQQQTPSSDSFTIIYKIHIDKINTTKAIFSVPQLKFQVLYYPNEHLFHIRFNNENRTQFVLYADKSTDRLYSPNATLVLFLHVTSTMISCYVNCELTDQEFISDSSYIESFIRQIKDQNQYEYNRQSTLILFNKSIDQIGANFFCLKLDKKSEELLPDKYALRKFATALDILVNSLDSPVNHENFAQTTTQSTIQNVSAVNIPSINTYGSLRAPSSNPNLESTTLSLNSAKACSLDADCDGERTSMTCQSGSCLCPKRLFWSTSLHRCITCHDLLIGNRCFRLSNHKSTWPEANENCEDDNTIDEGQEYTMKLASNLNRTDIQYLKESFTQENDNDQTDYVYWIGATSQFDTKKSNYRTRRQVPTAVFRWYDNGEVAQLNQHDIWCSQTEYMSLATISNNELCVSVTSCGLYADDCQRNYRFLCEAV